MKILDKDFKRRNNILKHIIADYEHSNDCLNSNFNNALRRLKGKLSENEIEVLKSMLKAYKLKILSILASSNRIKILYDINLQYIDFDAVNHIFDDLDD